MALFSTKRNRYNQVPHLNQDTYGKVTNSQLYTTNESQEVSLFPAGDNKAQINRRAQRHNKHKTEKHKRSTKEESRGGRGSRTRLKNHKSLGFLSKSGPDPLKTTKLPSLHSMFGHNLPMMVRF